jgi:hypothetical protein
MATPYESALTDLEELDVRASPAEVVTWRGRGALKLNGLALLRGLEVSEATIEVDICAEESAYPGIAFRVADVVNFQLAYAVPHCSGVWDALQYDPVFRGSNTWQLYHGEAYQGAATVPMGEWFHLRVDVRGNQAAISVNDQLALAVPQLAHAGAPGQLGVWTTAQPTSRDCASRSARNFQGPTRSRLSSRQMSSAMVSRWVWLGEV